MKVNPNKMKLDYEEEKNDRLKNLLFPHPPLSRYEQCSVLYRYYTYAIYDKRLHNSKKKK